MVLVNQSEHFPHRTTIKHRSQSEGAIVEFGPISFVGEHSHPWIILSSMGVCQSISKKRFNKKRSNTKK